MISELCEQANDMVDDIPRLEARYGARPAGYHGETIDDRFREMAAKLHTECVGCDCGCHV